MDVRKNHTITCVGEAIVDFFARAQVSSLTDATEFQRRAGGAAANVCAGIAKLGGRAEFIGAVGDDPFGRFLLRELGSRGVVVSGLQILKGLKTRLAFVSVGKDGSRSFEFWEKDPADTRVEFRRNALKSLERSCIIHFSSFLLLDEPSCTRSLKAAESLQECGGILSFDPNIRFTLWSSKRLAKLLLRKMTSHCHVLRLNDEEAYFLAGTHSLGSAARVLHTLGPDVIVITLGEDGCYFSSPCGSAIVPPFHVKAIDTTGCGDAFLAGLLTGIAASGRKLDDIDLAHWYRICLRANAIGALTATKQGAIDAIPTTTQVEQFLKNRT